MQYLFGFHETLEVVTNDVHELAKNTIDDRLQGGQEERLQSRVLHSIGGRFGEF